MMPWSHKTHKYEDAGENEPAVWTYMSRKSLSTTAEMSSKGFPIPKSVFSLWRDRNILYYAPTHQLCTDRGHKQSAVIQTIICF